MASSKELKAIISIAGTIDPSLSKAINQATKMTGGLGTALRVADGVFKVGGAAMAAGTAAAIGFGKASIDAGMEFDSSMSQVAATMGTTVDQITDLRNFAQEMGATTAFSATEAADALNYMALAGYDAEESMSMLPTVLDLAAAGDIDLAHASDMVTDAQSALGLSAEETKTMVDQMAKAASNSNTSVEQLGDAYLKIGATARNVKGGTEELATVLGVLADNSIKGEEGGTHLRNMILSLQNPTEKGAAALEQLGVAVYDTDGNMRSLIDIVGDIQTGMGDMDQASRDAMLNGLFNKTDLAAVNALLGTSSERFDELSTAIQDSAGAAQQMAATRLDNLAGDITLFKSALESSQIALSDALSPALREFVQLGTDGLTQITTALREEGLAGAMDALGQLLADGIAMIADAIPQVVDMGIQLLGALGQGILSNMDVIIDAAVKIAESALNAVIVALPALMDGIMQVIVSVLTDTLGPEVGQAVQSIYDNITELGGQIIDIVGEIGSTIMPIITDIIQAVLPFISQLIDALMPGIQSTLEALEPAISALLTALQPVIDAALNALPPIIDLISTIISALSVELAPMLEMITELIEAILPVITEVVSYWIEEIGLISQFVSDVFKGDWEAAWLDIQNIFSTAWESMQGIFSAAVEALSTIGQSLLDFFTTMWSNVTEAWSTGIATLGELVVSALTPVVQSILDTFTTLKENVGLAFEGIKEAILNSQLAETVRTIIDEIRLIFEGILSWLQDTFIGTWTTIWETVKNVFKTIWESLAGIVKNVFNAVIGLINKVIGAINNIHVNVPGPLQGIVGMASWGPHIDELPMLARGGFTKGASIAGEAGTEAVISFDSSVRRENLSYWAKAGKLLGVNATAVDTLAASAKDRSSSAGNSIVFSPNVTIEGNADYDMVLQALRDNEEEFMDMVQEFFGNKMRVSYG